MSQQIDIFDTTLRDGEQTPGCTLTLGQKLRLAQELEELGVDVIEAGFPASSPGEAQSVTAIAAQVKHCQVAGLARARRSDVEVLAQSLAKAKFPRIHIVLGSSSIHLDKKLKFSAQQAIDMASDAVQLARQYCDQVEYSLEDFTRSDMDYVHQVVTAVIEAGATIINCPDTVGYAMPDEFGAKIRQVKQWCPPHVKLSVHCHNDLGCGTANTIAAIQAGAQQVEVTMNGLGERAGNTALEEIAAILHTRAELLQAHCHIDLKKLTALSHLVSDYFGIGVQPNKAVVGAHAFAHSSGIHQDGILKDRSTYEALSPETVGVVEHKMVLTARSGRHAVRHVLKRAEISYLECQFEAGFEEFLKRADRGGEVKAEELMSIFGS